MPGSALALRLEARYQAELRSLWERVLAIVGEQFRSIDVDDLADAFRRFVPSAGGVVELGQRQAQALAAAFVRAYVEAETGRAYRPAPAGDRIAGTMRDGRSVAAALSGATGAVWMALSAGRPRDASLAFGANVVAAASSSAIADAAWREQDHQAERSGGVITGWTWVTTGASSCPACLSRQDGRVRPNGVALERHSKCDCTKSPAILGVFERFRRPTGEDLFRELAPDQQAVIFKSAGEEKAAAIREGRATLADFATVAPTSRGPVVTEAGLAAAGMG